MVFSAVSIFLEDDLLIWFTSYLIFSFEKGIKYFTLLLPHSNLKLNRIE